MSKNGFTYSSRKIDVNKKITIVASKWNAELVDELLESGKAHLEELGFTNINIVHVPGFLCFQDDLLTNDLNLLQ